MNKIDAQRTAASPAGSSGSALNTAVWCAVMVAVALSPLLGSVGWRSVALVAVLGAVVGAVLTALRGRGWDQYLAAVFVLVLIVGALVASTSHRSLALSWVGGLVTGLLGAAPLLSPRDRRPSGGVG